MRILQVHNYYQQKGSEDIVLDKEYGLLKSHGYNVKLFTVHNSDVHDFLNKAKTAWQTTYSIAGKRLLAREIQQFGTDIVHVHNFPPMLSPL